MDAYHLYMAEQIADEIKCIEDPLLLSIYLRVIIAQRCKIGGAIKGTCQECIFQGYYCRELYEINEHELKIYDEGCSLNDND